MRIRVLNESQSSALFSYDRIRDGKVIFEDEYGTITGVRTRKQVGLRFDVISTKTGKVKTAFILLSEAKGNYGVSTVDFNRKVKHLGIFDDEEMAIDLFDEVVMYAFEKNDIFGYDPAYLYSSLEKCVSDIISSVNRKYRQIRTNLE